MIRINYLLLTLACVLNFNSYAFAAPRLQLLEDAYNFGVVNQGEVVKKEFVLKNTGDQSLRIDRIVPACGCTVSTLEKNELAPGDQTSIQVALDTSGFSGAKIKTVRIYSNDPDQITKLISLRGDIQPEVIVDPPRLNFGQIVNDNKASSGDSQTINIKIRGDSNASLGKVLTRSRWLKVNVTKDTEKEKVIEVKLDSNVKVGEFRDRIVVEVKNSKQSTVNVPVYASIVPTIQIKPSIISFGIVQGKEPLTREVRVGSRGKSKITIDTVKLDHPALTANIVKADNTKGDAKIKITIDPSMVKKDLKSVVKVEITEQGGVQSEVPIAVTAVLPPELISGRK
jgi:hypothetical protein